VPHAAWRWWRADCSNDRQCHRLCFRPP